MAAPHQWTGMLLAAISVTFLLVPFSAAADDGISRGSRFTITITGAPGTPYYVWPAGTFTLSGEPGNQAPVIVASQQNIEKDPPEGPYTIGSYQFSGGNGRTIRDDVPPSTPSLSSTRYYARVTTDNDGRAVVAFQTSVSTAIRTFSIKVEQSPSAAKGTFLVQRGDLPVLQDAVTIGTPSTVPPSTPVSIPAPLSPETTPALPAVTPPAPSLPATTPLQQAPGEIALCTGAAGAGLLGFRHRR